MEREQSTSEVSRKVVLYAIVIPGMIFYSDTLIPQNRITIVIANLLLGGTSMSDRIHPRQRQRNEDKIEWKEKREERSKNRPSGIKLISSNKVTSPQSVIWLRLQDALVARSKAMKLHIISLTNQNDINTIQPIDFSFHVRNIALSPTNDELLITTSEGEIWLYNIEGQTSIQLPTFPRSNLPTTLSPNVEWSYSFNNASYKNRLGITSLSWSVNNLIALGCDNNSVWIYNPQEKITWPIKERKGAIFPYKTEVSWSYDGSYLVSVSKEGITCWDATLGKPRPVFEEKGINVRCLTWLPNSTSFIVGHQTGAILVFDAKTSQITKILEGHENTVCALTVSYDGKLLASKSEAQDSRVVFWRTDTWAQIANIKLYPFETSPILAFHPNKPLLASGSDNSNSIIDVWEINEQQLIESNVNRKVVQYRNAKIILLGEHGVGKTSLSLVLTGVDFTPPESTHGRKVNMLKTEQTKVSEGIFETREIMLWDLAGQASYRLIHQLSLSEVAVAVLLFDGKSETDIFASLSYWNKALQKSAIQGNTIETKKVLVEAMVDRTGRSVSQERIDEIITAYRFDAFLRTSAKENINISELYNIIVNLIDWNTLPVVSSTESFQSIKGFFMREKEDNRIISSLDDLYDIK